MATDLSSEQSIIQQIIIICFYVGVKVILHHHSQYQYNKTTKMAAWNIKFFKIIFLTPLLGSTETLKLLLSGVTV